MRRMPKPATMPTPNLYNQATHNFRRETLQLSSRRVSLFYYVGNIVRNLQGRYDGITRKSTAGCTIAEGDFLIIFTVFSE